MSSITSTTGGERPSNFDVNLSSFRQHFTADGAIKAGQTVTLTGNSTVSAVVTGSTHTNPTIGIAYDDASDGTLVNIYTPFLCIKEGVTATAALVAGNPVRADGLVGDAESFKTAATGEFVSAVVLSVGGATVGSTVKVGVFFGGYTA